MGLISALSSTERLTLDTLLNSLKIFQLETKKAENLYPSVHPILNSVLFKRQSMSKTKSKGQTHEVKQGLTEGPE